MKNTEREERIRSEFDYIIRNAKNDRQNIRYWLEKLPTSEDYDVTLHDYMTPLESAIRKGDDEYVEILVDELVDYYMVNWEEYGERFY